jgi:hypothetical protein
VGEAVTVWRSWSKRKRWWAAVVAVLIGYAAGIGPVVVASSGGRVPPSIAAAYLAPAVLASGLPAVGRPIGRGMRWWIAVSFRVAGYRVEVRPDGGITATKGSGAFAEPKAPP